MDFQLAEKLVGCTREEVFKSSEASRLAQRISSLLDEAWEVGILEEVLEETSKLFGMNIRAGDEDEPSAAVEYTEEEQEMRKLLEDEVRYKAKIQYTPDQLKIIDSLRRKANLERYGHE